MSEMEIYFGNLTFRIAGLLVQIERSHLALKHHGP